MLQFTGYRYRLYPSPDQEQALRRWAGCARAIWNAALEQRTTAWKMGHRVSRAAQDRELTEAKRAHPWLAEPHSDVLQEALRNLDRAFYRFFVGGVRHPRFKGKGHDSFRIYDRGSKGRIDVRRLNRGWGEVRVPKLGWVRFRWSRKPRGKVSHLTIVRDSLGWHVSLFCKRQVERPAQHLGPPIGVDRGVRATVALSTGEVFRCPTLPPKQAERLKRLEHRASRQEMARRRRPPGQRRRSARHARTVRAVARLRAREARIRNDFLNKVSRDLTKNHGMVVIERLNVVALTRSASGTIAQPGTRVRAKSALNRGMRAQGWGELRRQLAYKSERAGGELIEVPAAYTSQRCAKCHVVDAASRKERRFACVACGHEDDADVNGAKNILAAGQAVTARGALANRQATKRELPDGGLPVRPGPERGSPRSCAGKKSNGRARAPISNPAPCARSTP